MKNRKGFTLVELLAVIVVIALVLGITIYGVTNIFKETKSKTAKLDEAAILKSAKIYAGEVPENSWIEDGQNKYFCVTIEELQNKGLIDKKAILEGNLVKTNYVMFTKDKITLVSDNGNISENSICTGNEEKEQITNYPKLETGESYTDTIELSYEPGKASSPITSTKCYYGTNTSLIEKEGIVSNKTCTIGKLNNKSDYYVRVCQTTEKGSTICSKTENRKTEDFESTEIKEENDNITITYNDEKIIGTPGHYFMSSVPGTSATNVSSCTLNNDIFTCSETTKEIESNQWYKTESSSIKINYSLTGKIKITTRITDSSHNYKEKNKDVTIYNTAYIYLKIDTDKEKIDSPTTYTDGSVYQWSTDNNGYITRSNAGGNTFSTYIQKYKHGITNTDLSNYNYSPYINISRKDSGYHVPSGEEWKCLSGCTTTGKTFGQSNDYKYKSTDFCDTSKGSCEVVLGVNWQPNTYTITYYLGNGTSTAGATKLGTSTCTYGSSCKLNSWSSFNKSMPNSYWSFAGWSKTTSGTARTYTDGATFTYNTTDNIKLYAVGSRSVTFSSGKAPTSLTSSQTQYWNPYSTDSSYLTKINVPTATAISGWTYYGYRANDVASSTRTLSTTGSQDLRYDYYSIFRAIYSRTATLKFNANGGSGSTANATATQYYNSGTATNGKNSGANESTPTFTLTANGFTRTGYSFNGWNTKADGSGTSYTNNASVSNLKPGSDGTATLYAKWSGNTVKITFNKNGGSGGTDSMYYKFNTNKFYSNSACTTQITSVSSPSKTGYSFAGYQGDGTSGGGKGEFFPNDLSKTDIYYKIYKDATLTAKWKDDIKPTITMSPTDSKSITTGTKLTLTCTDNGSGMQEAILNDNNNPLTVSSTSYPSTLSKSDTLATCRKASDKSIKTIATCTDKDRNTSTETFYYTVTGCSTDGGGGGGSSCNNSTYKYCITSASDAAACTKKGGSTYTHNGDCYKSNSCTCLSGWIAVKSIV